MFKNLQMDGRVTLWQDPESNGKEFITLEPIRVTWMEGNKWKKLIVPGGFSTDLASIPNFLNWAVPKLGRHNRPSVVHDWLYDIRDKRGKDFADDLFYACLLHDGVGRIRARLMYKAVKRFGQGAWND
jgi:hypothetical protein